MNQPLLTPKNDPGEDEKLDLAPAHWIWFPSERTLANTFVLFRREIHLAESDWPLSCEGWLVAESRYILTVNGERVQWGPAPHDPRYVEADPVDLAPFLKPGRNVIGVEVLYYGSGDGTWVMSKPGLLLKLQLRFASGRLHTLVSDTSWLTYLDRAHRPGQYRRWYLRALQEDFDARLHPYGWDTPEFGLDKSWLAAQELDGPADRPALFTSYLDYSYASEPGPPEQGALLARTIPLLLNQNVAALSLRAVARLEWQRDPADWFEFRTPGSFVITGVSDLKPFQAQETAAEESWQVASCAERESVALTFEFKEQMVGWPYFEIEAPAGTVIELICQEAHDSSKVVWLDNHLFSWTRFVCREGWNRFETFDFESLRWLQLHIHNHSRLVTVRGVGLRRRLYNWPNQPRLRCSDPALTRLFEASINTLYNSAQETIVDGMGRERQQYSGDVGHQLVAIRYAFGETRLPARFLTTFSQGLSVDGYFFDCWPGFDRQARMMSRSLGMSQWGPLLDHGVGFVFDCWQHYEYTGEVAALYGPYQQIVKFIAYLETLVGPDGLLPVEDLGVPAVWLDSLAYHQQRHKQCAFNLYTAAMLQHALSPLARLLATSQKAQYYHEFGQQLEAAALATFWDDERKVWVINRPWLGEEGGVARLCDRSLATALLFGMCPGDQIAESLKSLLECPAGLGLSYPANALWRYLALARHGQIATVLAEFRTRWATLDSVIQNNTLSEYWQVHSDSPDEWSHCPMAPLNLLFTQIVGLRPLTPGFARAEIQPQLGDLENLEVTLYTPKGPLTFSARRGLEPLAEQSGELGSSGRNYQWKSGKHFISVTAPAGCELIIRTTEVNEPG